ncbi:hypothetical protein ACFLYH_00865 [Candidatus Dependentiae bacterium]
MSKNIKKISLFYVLFSTNLVFAMQNPKKISNENISEICIVLEVDEKKTIEDLIRRFELQNASIEAVLDCYFNQQNKEKENNKIAARVMNSTSSFSGKKTVKNINKDDKCPICFSRSVDFEEKSQNFLVYIKGCNHVFCKDCIDKCMLPKEDIKTVEYTTQDGYEIVENIVYNIENSKCPVCNQKIIEVCSFDSNDQEVKKTHKKYNKKREFDEITVSKDKNETQEKKPKRKKRKIEIIDDSDSDSDLNKEESWWKTIKKSLGFKKQEKPIFVKKHKDDLN